MYLQQRINTKFVGRSDRNELARARIIGQLVKVVSVGVSNEYWAMIGEIRRVNDSASGC